MKKTLLAYLLVSCQLIATSYKLSAQCTDCFAGGHKFPHAKSHNAMNTNVHGTLSQAYLLQNVCGLNFTQATNLTETRTAANGFNFGSTGFPTTLSITGLPSMTCASIVKAYIYYGCTYTETTPPTTSATVTNPSLSVSTIPATMVGTTLDDICWPGPGSATYRVDVTSMITGNGNYKVDLNGFANDTNEVDGVTLIVIYSDATASYSGSIVLDDGDMSNDAGDVEEDTVAGFTVCSASSNAVAFTLLADVQNNVSGGVNTEIYNGDSVVFPNNFWNYCNVPVSLTSAQNSCIYNTYTNNNSDCYFIALAGLYWQNTNCVTCTPVITTMTLTTSTTPANCGNNGTASVTVTGGAGPLTYLWSPGGATSSNATSLAPGTYTVNVTDGSTCASDTVSVINTGMFLSTSSSNASCLITGSAWVNVTGGSSPYTYSWSNGATSSSINAAAGIYSVTVTDNTACSMSASVVISNSATFYINVVATNAYACPATLGSATAYTYNGKAPYTYSWSNGQTTAIMNASAGAYSVTVTDSNGCTATDTTSITLLSSAITVLITNTGYFCAANPGSATALPSGGNQPYTYLWTPGGQTGQGATGLTLGSYTVTVTDSNGCNQSASVSVSSASVSFTVNGIPTTIVIGDSSALSAYCNIPATFSWTPSSSLSNSNLASTEATPTVTTTYTVTAITACDTLTDTITIFVSCANNYNEQICIVTVDTATDRNEIIWGRLNSPPTGSYNVYKETSSFTFSLLVNQSDTLYSDYIDTASRPEISNNTYELATVDSCGVSALSPPHTSIFLSDTAGINVNILNWTGYVGFTPSQYDIYRGATLSSLTQIGTVSATTFTYHDTLPPASCVYLVSAVNPSGPCIPTRRMVSSSDGINSLSNKVKAQNVTGIPTIASNDQINVYPNPSNGVFTIVGTQNFVTIEVYNMIGEKVYSFTPQTPKGALNEIDLNNQPDGIYTLKGKTENGISVKKIVLIR